MFRENNEHLQDNLFNSLYSMNQRLAHKLQNSWAELFYEHVFCKIDENLFAPLYSSDNGRPNFPVNILMSLDLIKEIREYTDEVLLDDYAFNYQRADDKTHFLYQLKKQDISSRIQSLIDQGVEVLQHAEKHPELKSIKGIQLLDRFLREQAVFNPEENRRLAKEAKEIFSTCRDENPVQIVTHYDLAPNTTRDIELLKRALPTLSEQGIKDVYTDGGYYSPEMREDAQIQGITVHYTEMTGRKTSSQKLPYSAFEIEDKRDL